MLSDEEIVGLRKSTGPAKGYTHWGDTIGFGRAIESAACAERDARIAELTAELELYKAAEAVVAKEAAARARAEQIADVMFPTYSAVAARNDPSLKPLQWHEKSWWWNGVSINWHESDGFDSTGGQIVLESYVGGGETETISVHIPLVWLEAGEDQWEPLVHQHKKDLAAKRAEKARAAEQAKAEREIEAARATLARLGAGVRT